MPEAITIKQEPTPSLSPDNEVSLQEEQQAPASEEHKFAGKFDSPEELEKAYLEAQKKLSQNDSAPTEEEESSESGSEPESETQEAESKSAQEIYGDFIGGKLDEAGVDYQTMNSHWQENGTLDESHYKELEGIGFNKETVDSYLEGIQYRRERDNSMTVKQANEVMTEFGGEVKYREMTGWAKDNLSPAEIKAFDNAVNSPDPEMVKLAITGLQAKYQATADREPKLIGGKTPRRTTDVFESTAQVIEAMSNPKYQSDPAYRAKVEQKLSRSNVT